MNFSRSLAGLLQGRNLTAAEAENFLEGVVRKKISKAQAKAALLLLAQKGESAEEVLGCLRAVRRLEPVYRHSFKKLLDTCGTGGDGSHSLNISTLAAIVIAGAGGKVAKHGNRGLSSKCGSSDVLEALGLTLYSSASSISRSIKKNGIGYLHAPAHHPVFAQVQPLRRELKTRTVFNLLGPLVNPFTPQYQLIGVASKKVFELYIQVLRKLKVTALICRSLDGMDEISITHPTETALISKGKVRRFKINPRKYFRKTSGLSVKGGNPYKNAGISKSILRSELRGPGRDMVVLNAAAGLWLLGIAKSLKQGVQKAEQSLNSGKAYEALRGMTVTQS